jgi:flavin-dependent dehydrogenase
VTVDVAIIGGGPAGSTAASLLRKYDPNCSVAILEREAFPRDHVGESQLPPISAILAEMGCWDKVEAAGFPIKIGATYRWGTTTDLWDFEFLPGSRFMDEPRPAQYVGQRTKTAFQVDRAIYDKILLDHAADLGANILQPERVMEVVRDGDSVRGLRTESNQLIEANHYIDASGHSGILRRAMGVSVEEPSSLRNVAIWSYWHNADWAVQIGVGGTRVQVLSLGYGWIWFIPLGPTRTSIGLIIPAEYYKATGQKPETIYEQAIASDPMVSSLVCGAGRESKVQTTKDWSFTATRLTGENWFLAGESAGFADPILAAGMTLAHAQAREVAYSILSIRRKEQDATWLKERYDTINRGRIRQHIRFADFWYSANTHFTELKEYCRTIASDAGLDLQADKAFQWLGQGGFVYDQADYPSIGTFPLGTVKHLVQSLGEGDAHWKVAEFSYFTTDISGADQEDMPVYRSGSVSKLRCYVRGGKRLPYSGVYKAVMSALAKSPRADHLIGNLMHYYEKHPEFATPQEGAYHAVQALEVMVLDGWVQATLDPRIRPLAVQIAKEDAFIHPNRDNRVSIAK